jgi:flagellar motor switch/type III secretory pathway protein FliN
LPDRWNDAREERVMAGTGLVKRNAEVSITTGSESANITPAVPWMTHIEEHPSWEILARLRVTLRAVVALDRFKVKDLLSLKEGQVFESLSPDTDDVTLLIGQVPIGWSEFEVLDQRMALRLTRLG